MMLAAGHGERGFTLIELLMAIFIFSMVMGGLAVIYSTAFHSGIRMLHETRLKSSATLSSRALQQEITSATYVDIPVVGASGKHLQGYHNVAYTSGGAMISNQMINTITSTWFHFCVSNQTNAPCGDPQFDISCLWYYSGDGDPSTPPPTINDANCGQAAGGVTPQILATHIVSVVPGVTANAYFSRATADEVAERNQVRVNFVMRQGATANHPPLSFNFDSAYNMNFSK